MASDLTIITVTHNTWETYTSRLIRQVFHYVDPEWYAQWFMVDNDSDDADKITRAMLDFPDEHKRKFTLVRSDMNIGDLPQYNRVVPSFVATDKVLCISTDMRIFKETIPWFNFLLDWYDIAGSPGPSVRKEAHEDDDNPWHWIPRLLIERGYEDFQSTAHIQSHCIGFTKSAFIEVGGFWEPDDGRFLDKGNLIAGEMILSLNMRKAKKRILALNVPMYHYGNQMSAEQMQEFDMKHGWDMSFDVEEEEFEIFKLGVDDVSSTS